MITINKLKSNIQERKPPTTPQTRSSVNSPESKSVVINYSNPKIGLQTIQETPKETNRKLQQQLKVEKTHSAHSSQTFVTAFYEETLNSKIKSQKKQPRRSFVFKPSHYNKKIVEVNENILEIYNEYEKNYKSIGDLDKQEPISTQSIMHLDQTKPSNVSLSYVTTFDGLKSTDLEVDSSNYIKVNRFKFYYMRARLYGKVSPVQIFFNCPEKVQTSNMKIFLSTKAEFPTKFNCNISVTSKFAKIYSQNNQSYFTEKFLFITFYSDLDFDLNVEIIFGNPQYKFKKRPIQIETEEFIPSRAVSVRSPKRDKIYQNLNMLPYQSQEKLRKLLCVQSERSQKQKQVLFQKKENFQEKQLDKLSKLLARDQMFEYREFKKKLDAKQAYDKQVQIGWLQVMYALKFSETIYQLMTEQKRRNKVVAKGRWIAELFTQKELLSVKKYGHTPKERVLFKSKLSMLILANLVEKKAKKKAKKIMTNFMRQTLLSLITINRYKIMIQKIVKIQRKFKYLRSRKRLYKEKFWRACRDKLYEIVSQQKQTKLFQSEQKKNFHIQIDIPLMYQLMEEYNQTRRDKFAQYVKELYLEKKDTKQHAFDMAMNMTKPKLYEIPIDDELEEIVLKYMKIKKM